MTVRVLLGDCRKVLPTLQERFDCCIADPPYGDTSLDWDELCGGWIAAVAGVLKPAASLWVFGSLRSLAPLFHEMASHGFRYSQDIVWEKQNGTGFHADRFRRVHEHAALFYRGAWSDVYHEPQFVPGAKAKTVRRKTRPTHTGHIERGHYTSVDGGPLLMRSVLRVKNEHGRAIHPTQKPLGLLLPLVRYSCPPNGSLIVPFAGGGSECLAAKIEGRSAIGVELRAEFAAAAEHRLITDAPLLGAAA